MRQKDEQLNFEEDTQTKFPLSDVVRNLYSVSRRCLLFDPFLQPLRRFFISVGRQI